jgi:hypothetical protein
LTWPNGGTSYDLWDETNHDHLLDFQIQNTQRYFVVSTGFDGDQLVLGLSTDRGQKCSELYVYNIRQGSSSGS